jgi:hypothetical protein
LQSQYWNGLETKTLGTKVQHFIPRPVRHQFTQGLFTDVADYTTVTLCTATEVSDCSRVSIYTTLIGSYTITRNLNKNQFFTHYFNHYASVNEIALLSGSIT